METNSDLLIAYGFMNPSKKQEITAEFPGKTPDQILTSISIKRKTATKDGKEADFTQKLTTYANHDEMEVVKDQLMLLNYPKPLNRYYLTVEKYHESIEPYYYWILNNLQQGLGFPWIEKVTDLFAAAEHSSYFGATGQKLGAQQDKVQQFLAAIGGFIRKDLFQLVRDIRWIDERIRYHDQSRERKKKDGQPTNQPTDNAITAEITLKGIWTDMVDGVVQGQRVGANVIQMAQQLDFKSLPDFFFSLTPTRTDQIAEIVDAIPTTVVLKNVLKRKLEQFLVWKESNYAELKQRRLFELKYLRQHYNIIKMYMNWLKPYLRHISRLRADVTKLNRPELVASFESSMAEIEILASKIPKGNEQVYACILANFDYKTRPRMDYTTEGYHRGPVHIGETRVTWRSYAWTKEQIKNYLELRERDDLELLKSIDSSISAAMEAIGDDLWKYLEQADDPEAYLRKYKKIQELKSLTQLSEQELEKMTEEQIDAILKAKEEKKPGFFDPFTDIWKNFGELGRMFTGPSTPKEDKAKEEKMQAEIDTAKTEATKMCFLHYKLFKKNHGMMTW